MSDDITGAVRRTPRPYPSTDDHQTPETGAPVAPGATNPASPVSPDAGPATGDLRVYEVTLTRDIPVTGGRVLFAGPECDMEAYAALPPCMACGGGGQDDHGTVFEASLAVHFAGPYVTIGGRRRQLCAWCGHVLLDVHLAPGQEHEPWFDVKLVRVEDGTTTRQPYTYGDPLPPGCCALPDDEQPTPGPGCYPPADGWDGVSTVDVDPNDGYPVDLCGKHTGNCSNRCLLPAHHDGECDDDPRPDEAQETRAADWPAEETDHG